MVTQHSKAIRVVMRWQLAATTVLALIAAFGWGLHAAVSTLIGGVISFAAGVVFVTLASTGGPDGAGYALRTVLRAEAGKVMTVVVLLGLAMTSYKQVVHVGLIGSFIVSTLIFSLAVAVRDR